MGLDGRYTAVIDRFEDDQAVLLVEKDEEVVREFVVGRQELPEDARKQDAVLEVMLDSGNVREFSYLPDETRQRKTDAQDRFDRLSQRPPPASDTSRSEDGPGSTDGTDSDDVIDSDGHPPSDEVVDSDPDETDDKSNDADESSDEDAC